MDRSYYVTLDEAADDLGVTAIALFARAARGTVWAGLVGTTWVTTHQEVERIRSERLLPAAARHRPEVRMAVRPV